MTFLNKALLLACLPGLLAVAAPAGAPARKKGYEAFRFVQTRNIFDPKRNADAVVQSDTTGNTAAPAAQATQPPATGADYAALTGVLVTEEKTLAFFSGSRPEFNKVLPAMAVIAGATINKIGPAAIEVQRDGKLVTVAIGQTVPLDASAVPGPAPFNPPPPPATAGTSPASSSDTAPASSDQQAVLKRMMERRQKELK